MSITALTDLRDRLGDIIDQIVTEGSECVVTRHGKPVAVILGYDEYESLVETLNVLSDSETMEALAEAREDVAHGDLAKG